MKKSIFLFLTMFSTLIFAQENADVKKETKFQVGIHYLGNLRNNNSISNGFNGIVGISGNYTFYKNDLMAFSGGINLDYMQSRDYFYPNDILILNPNASIELDLFEGKLSPFLGIGYAFFRNKFEYETPIFDPSDPAFLPRERKVNFNGFTINPGLKYHVSDLLFIEGSYKYYPVKSDDFAGSSHVHLINFGIGFKF